MLKNAAEEIRLGNHRLSTERAAMKVLVTFLTWMYAMGAFLTFMAITAQEDSRHVHQGVRDRVGISLIWPLGVALQFGEHQGNIEADRQQKRKD
jgi:hypothetical protein